MSSILTGPPTEESTHTHTNTDTQTTHTPKQNNTTQIPNLPPVPTKIYHNYFLVSLYGSYA